MFATKIAAKAARERGSPTAARFIEKAGLAAAKKLAREAGDLYAQGTAEGKAAAQSLLIEAAKGRDLELSHLEALQLAKWCASQSL